MAKPRPSDIARQFFTSLRGATCAPVYLVYGEESYLLDQAVDAILKLAAPEGLNAFNFDSFQGKDLKPDTFAQALEMLPFMCKRRVVLVRDMQEANLKELDVLSKYLDDPSPTTCLVIHAMTSHKTLDGRSSLVQKLKKHAQVGEFKAFYEQDAEQFVHKQAAQRGMRLDPEASAYLMRALGTSLSALDQALEKIDLYLGAAPEQSGPRAVTRELLEEIIAETRLGSVFELTEALGDRKLEVAMHLLDRMMISGESAIGINMMIARHFRILNKLKDPSVRGLSNNDTAKALGLSAYFLKDYQRHADKFSSQEVEAILYALLGVDMALKSSKLSDQVIMQALLLEITQSGATTRPQEQRR